MTSTRRTTITVSLPWLLGSVAVVCLLAAGIYALHGYQLRRSALMYVQRAEALLQQDDYRQASNYLYRYLQLRPDDTAVRVQLAEVYDRSARSDAQKGRAVELYYRALGVAPQRDTLRVRLAELLYELEQYHAALQEAEAVLERRDSDQGARRIQVLAAFSEYRADRVTAEQLQQVVDDAASRHPDDAVIIQVYAYAYRRYFLLPDAEQRARRADQAMQRLVEDYGDRAPARLARYRYRVRFRLPGAEEDLSRALELSPDNPLVRLEAGRASMQAGRYGEALSHLVRAEAATPSDSVVQRLLGDCYAATGQTEKAIGHWRKGLSSAEEERPALQLRLAEALLDAQQLGEADQVLDQLEDRLQRSDPGDRLWMHSRSEVDFLRARQYLAQQRRDEAIALLRRVISLSDTYGSSDSRLPGLPVRALLLQAQIHAEQDEWDLAGAACRRALELDDKCLAAWLGSAAAWSHLGRYASAFEAAERARQLAPQDARVQKLLGQLHLHRAMERMATSAPHAWPEIALEDAGWQGELLKILQVHEKQETQELAEALRSFSNDYADDPAVWRQLALIYQYLGRTEAADEAIAAFRRTSADRVEAALLEAKLCLLRGQAAAAQQCLQHARRGATAKQQLVLLDALLQLQQSSSGVAGQEAILREMLELDSRNPELLRRLATLLLEQNRVAEAEQLERQLREWEGSDGVRWRLCRAHRLLREVSGPGDVRLASVLKLQNEILARRPTWPPAEVLRGVVAEKQQLPQRALEAYSRAVELGCRETAVLQHAVELALAEQRGTAAGPLLAALMEAAATVPPRYHLLWAEHLESAGNTIAADAAYRRALTERPDSGELLAEYIAFLLRQKRLDDADRYLAELESSAPTALTTLRLRADWLRAKGQIAELGTYLEALAEQQLGALADSQQQHEFGLAVARTYAAEDRPDDAERWFRRVADQHAEGYVWLAQWLAERGRTRDAVEICLEQLERAPTAAAALTLAEVLMRGPSDPRADQLAEAALQNASQDYRSDVPLLLAISHVRLKQDRQTAAIRLLQRVTRLDPNNVWAWNNLAALQAEDNEARQLALGSIDRALQIAGPLPTLLDTKATILAQLGRYEEAVRLWREEILPEAGGDPRFHFHLALALQALDRSTEARRAFDEAVRLGLPSQFLTQQERDRMVQLEALLAQSP